MPAGGSNPAGWYAPSMMRFGLRNDSIMYPDEGFIIAKRTSGALDIDFEGGAQTSAQKMRLPKSGGSACMSNPFGADMLISEIIPPILIGSGANKFNLVRQTLIQIWMFCIYLRYKLAPILPQNRS